VGRLRQARRQGRLGSDLKINSSLHVFDNPKTGQNRARGDWNA
jgi:hypothetical protein